MLKTARLAVAWISAFLFLTGAASAQAPTPISPSADDGVALVISGCPTFSWSEVESAAAYRVAVFELNELPGPLSYREMVILNTPVLELGLPDRGFSWTPSADRGLCAGDYVWYVAAVDRENTVEWSDGKAFRVDVMSGLDAVARKCGTLVSQAEIGEDLGREPRTPTADGAEVPDALSLEQMISSKVIREQLSRSETDARDSDKNATLSPGLLGDEGDSNTFYGKEAGDSTPGERAATFIGAYAGFTNHTGDYNTFVGGWAGYYNSSGSHNTFVGGVAGYVNDLGKRNTFVGHATGNSNSLGNDNTFVGQDAGYANGSDENTFIGKSAGRSNNKGHSNTFLGHEAGYSNVSGHGNVFIGESAGYNNIWGSDLLYIDNSKTDTPLIYGDFHNDFVKIYGELQMVKAAISSDVRLKRDIQPLGSSLGKVLALNGVSYQWKTEEYPGWGLGDNKQIGLIAQDVEGVIPELVSTDSKGYKAVSYDKLTAVLVEAVKELKAENEALKTENETFKAQVRTDKEKFQRQLNELRSLIKALRG